MRILTERTEMAKALNFGKYPVLTYDMDARKGSKVITTKESNRYGTMRHRCSLYCGKITENDGIFYLLTHGTMLSATASVDSYIQDAEYANAPVIEPNTEVAILVYSKKLNVQYVQIVKSGKVDPSYSTATTFDNIE